ncbi:hypothetical protein Pve01_95190 [Planomonospora venezuelensis]|uniref:hypothetical protein n=1 Tax=Nocardioides sp. Root151 TaxID=1736475 RepID=UPI000B126098|nr:hypothetical protein [Nocardioides sp. Root151]GIM65034.1 hypothetical protein Pve01_95190 [Planomonospora venezuelensis]
MPDTNQPRRATRTQVRKFLAAAGYEGTPPDDLVTEYVDLVGAAGRPGLPRHRLAVHLTAQSGVGRPSVGGLRGCLARAAAGTSAGLFRGSRHGRARR